MRKSPLLVRGGRRAPAIVGGVLVLVAVIVVGVGVLTDPSRSLGIAGDATVQASSTTVGSTPRSVVDTGLASDPGLEWRSGDARPGAWVELSWGGFHTVRQILLVASREPDHRIETGYLTFSDGSAVQVRLDPNQRATTVPLTARSVDRIRLTVTGLAPGATAAGLAEIVVGTDKADGGVVTDSSENVAAYAASSVSAGGPGAALTDGEEDGTGAAWSAPAGKDLWLQLDWDDPREVAAVQLVGASGGSAHARSGRLEFGDGSAVFVGEVLDDPGRPTVVAFMPRITRSVRFVVETFEGDGAISLAEVRVLRRDGTPRRDAAPGNLPRTPTGAGPTDASCSPSGANRAVGVVTVLCPAATSEVAGRTVLRFAAPGFTRVTGSVWAADPGRPGSAGVPTALDGDGLGELELDFAVLPRGPVTVALEASGGRLSRTTYLQLYNTTADPTPDVPHEPTAQAAGKTLVYDEEFSGPVSVSRDGTGADYAAAKPVIDGAEDFGDAIFPNPDLGFSNLSVVDDRYLRIAALPNPPGYADPGGSSKAYIGGLLASARTGGSGFAAQYGYFEARMTTPAGAGTWPAFWMLPNTIITAEQNQVAEIDVVEQYGTDPLGACHSTHAYTAGEDRPNTQCGRRFDDHRLAFAWHTYGALVTPTSIVFTIDGRVVADAPQVPGGEHPMFFLVDMALGGGWPVDLAPVGHRAAVYIDYVRVYV